MLNNTITLEPVELAAASGVQWLEYAEDGALWWRVRYQDCGQDRLTSPLNTWPAAEAEYFYRVEESEGTR